MTKALIALHLQNDICHPDGRVPFAVSRAAEGPERFLARCASAIERARAAGWLVVHVHIAFAPDYSDLKHNCRLFRAVEETGALKRGSWGAAPMQGFAPGADDVHLIHTSNSAFHRTGLEALLKERGVDTVAVIGLATQYSVEHTVREAADIGHVVTMIRDCCSSGDKDAAEASFKAMAMLADVKALDEVAF